MNTIKPAPGSKKNRKRVGRGNASGHGTYSTRGLKGQKSRSGVSNLKRLGMRQILLRTPKKRGFRSLAPKNAVINLSTLNLHFHDNAEVDKKTLFNKKLISDQEAGVKILGSGVLKVKNLKLNGLKISASAKEQIEKMGGQVR